MIRKSHSWSLAWTRDKSADQSGPSIVSLSSGQSVLQAHKAKAGCTSHFGPRISYLSRGWSFYPYRSSSDIRFPFAIIRVLFAIIRTRSRTFAIIRDIFTPPPPGGCGHFPKLRRRPSRAFGCFLHAPNPRLSFAPLPLSTTPHSTSVHERSTSVHEQSLNVQPFFTPPPPRGLTLVGPPFARSKGQFKGKKSEAGLGTKLRRRFVEHRAILRKYLKTHFSHSHL